MKKWMMALAATCAAAVMVLSGCGNTPSVHVTKAAISTEPFTLETKAAPEALHTAPVIPSVSGGLISNPPAGIGPAAENRRIFCPGSACLQRSFRR